MTRTGTLALACAVALGAVACPQAPPAVRASGPEARAHVEPSESALDAAPAIGARVEPLADVAPARPAPAPVLHLERVAALAADRMLAIGNGVLYRLAGDRWTRLALEGAVARDVVAARGSLWVLARGTGENAGTAIVLRSSGEDLRAVASPALGPDSNPLALAVAREGEYFIGGERPALVRVVLSEIAPVPVGAERVSSLRALRDEWLVAGHDESSGTAATPRRVSVARWGEFALVAPPEYFDTATTPDGRPAVVDTAGTFRRGRPGHTGETPWTAPAPFRPLAVGVLADGHPAVVGAAGPFATWQTGAWREVRGAFPQEPLAILATEPPAVVGRGGEVVLIEAAGPRTVTR